MKSLQAAYHIFKVFFFQRMEIIKADITQILVAVVEKVNLFNGSCGLPSPSFLHSVSQKIWFCTD